MFRKLSPTLTKSLSALTIGGLFGLGFQHFDKKFKVKNSPTNKIEQDLQQRTNESVSPEEYKGLQEQARLYEKSAAGLEARIAWIRANPKLFGEEICSEYERSHTDIWDWKISEDDNKTKECKP